MVTIGQIQRFESGNFDHWIEDFETLAEANGWTEDAQKLKTLPLYLEGEAKTLFRQAKKKKACYKAVCAALKAAFMEDPEFAKMRLRTTTKLEGESFSGFAARIRNEVELAYPELDASGQEVRSYETFKEGIPEKFRKAIYKDSSTRRSQNVNGLLWRSGPHQNTYRRSRRWSRNQKKWKS
ncbi:hypothetical protein RF11_06118 [Thelohanellus kitauei]|uniref:Retrotransposon gag domain-containing protein n=1 Tax=Thelohanellus kitauei TaxID=669202 RepID=A0A0C2M1E2_THEKT|nr:hypothetical protein RF11_06118 [Thelohanellus kitauei]